jgi:hypothetical protein
VGVEPGWAAGIHGHGSSVIRRRPACSTQLCGVGGVEGRVGGGGDGAGGGGAEEAAAEEVAMADADGVGTCRYPWLRMHGSMWSSEFGIRGRTFRF